MKVVLPPQVSSPKSTNGVTRQFGEGDAGMLFMVVEHFKPGRVREIYRLARDRGRGLPDGLIYVDSWVEAGLGRCFQLMECEDASLLQEWVLSWDDFDFGTFEIVPVVHSKQTAAIVERTSAASGSK